jgi:glutaminase-like protein
MIADGAQPEKVWIQGSLKVSSRNKPDCLVTWYWHVAPTLQVSNGGAAQTYVIDPSLFDGPVPQATWKALQGDPSATLTPTGADIFYLLTNPTDPTYTDPTYSSTNADLIYFRNQLKLRSAEPGGPPPYTSCMVKPGGTQWFGLIEGNQTQKWFTFGWPADRQMEWNIMPLTPCPNAPQLTWDVTVERADPSHVTYWISVKNLSADRVRFAGRYNFMT